MKNIFIKLLVSSVLFVGFVLNAHAGLITESINEDHQVNENGFNFYDPDNNLIIISTSIINQNDSADISWSIDTTGLESIDFNMKLLGSDSNFALASLIFAGKTLWSQAETMPNLSPIHIDFSEFDFASLISNTVTLSFMLQANNFNSSYVHVGRDKSSLQLNNIRLTRTEVPEPSTIMLLLVALAFITRKQLAK